MYRQQTITRNYKVYIRPFILECKYDSWSDFSLGVRIGKGNYVPYWNKEVEDILSDDTFDGYWITGAVYKEVPMCAGVPRSTYLISTWLVRECAEGMFEKVLDLSNDNELLAIVRSLVKVMK